MGDPRKLTPEEIDVLEALIESAEDPLIKDQAGALAAYKAGTASPDQIIFLHGLIKAVDEIEYNADLSDLEVRRRFGEAPVPELPPRPTDKDK